jgi:hypothetical protein
VARPCVLVRAESIIHAESRQTRIGQVAPRRVSAAHLGWVRAAALPRGGPCPPGGHCAALGKGGGGRGGGGRGGSRSATPIISSSVNEVHFFGDEGENAQDFESWVQDMQGEGAESEQLAAPAFANFFGGGSPPDEAELTEAIRDEIARASAVAAEAAVLWLQTG